MILVAALLVGGVSNAWAYDVPSGYEVKNVFFGTDNGDNTVTAEDFATTTATGWSLIGFSSDANNSVGISTITEVAKPEIGSKPTDAPTYVSGNCLGLTARDRKDAIKYTGYSFATVSSGYLVFDADIFGDGNYPSYVRFVDSDGNAVLTMHWTNGDTSASRAFRYQIGTDSEVATTLGGKPRTYHGYGIRDLVIDFSTGATSFKLDYITFAGARAVSSAVELNIGTGKNIAGIQLGYIFSSGNSNVTQHSYMDNIKLYTVGVESPSYTYTVKAKAGSTDLGTMSTGSCKGGMSFSATGLPYVIKNSGKYYVLTDAGVTNFGKSYTMENNGSNKDQEIEYTLDNTIVFYSEIEDLSNHGGESAGNYSAGVNAYIAGSKYSGLAELSRGEYSVKAAVNDRPDRGMIIRSAQSVAAENELAYITTATDGIMSGEFSLYENTTAYLSGITSNGKINQSATMDYIVIRKTADIPATVSKSITSAGWATYCSPYALDFSSDITNLDDAFIVTGGANGVLAKTSVKGGTVAAGTGLLLKGSAGTATIPVAATGTDYTATNKLTGVTTNTEIAAETGYVLMYDETYGLAFYKNQNAFTVGANTAYLPANFLGTLQSRSFFSFDGKVTGIDAALKDKGQMKSDVYNLNGQRVKKAAKGLYIVNGKKYVK